MGLDLPFFFTLAIFLIFLQIRPKVKNSFWNTCVRTSAKTAKPTVTRFCSMDVTYDSPGAR